MFQSLGKKIKVEQARRTEMVRPGKQYSSKEQKQQSCKMRFGLLSPAKGCNKYILKYTLEYCLIPNKK